VVLVVVEDIILVVNQLLQQDKVMLVALVLDGMAVLAL
jgi:hypothetical protein